MITEENSNDNQLYGEGFDIPRTATLSSKCASDPPRLFNRNARNSKKSKFELIPFLYVILYIKHFWLRNCTNFA